MTFEQWGIVLLAITQFGRMWLGFLTDKKINHIKKVGDETHALSNSDMGGQLKAYSLAAKMYYLAMKRIAELTNLPADAAAEEKALNNWIEAVKIVERHEVKESQAYKTPQAPWDGPDRRQFSHTESGPGIGEQGGHQNESASP